MGTQLMFCCFGQANPLNQPLFNTRVTSFLPLEPTLPILQALNSLFHLGRSSEAPLTDSDQLDFVTPPAMDYRSKKLINDPNDVVTEFIEGLVETYPGLQYLDGFPKVKVVLRADVSARTYDKVAVISGGGSGHEPAHAGFVGEGMLTAAICGDVFASPPVDSILAGIRAVTGSMGCLLIVKNYTGDRLNFGLAAEQAKSEGYAVEMVIVGDDCALPPPRGIAGRRGLAGTIFVHKVAGAAAAAGLSLAEVAAEAKRASEMVGTMGVALSVCTLPGQVTPDRLGPGKMELGLGIHGEPGAAVADLQPVDIVVSHVLKQILSTETNYVPITRGSRIVLMVNGLGATPVMELMIAAGKAVPVLQLEHGLAVDRVYTGSFMTSLDMAGFSITVMKADQKILNRLDAPTKAPNWPVGTEGRPPAKLPIPLPQSRSTKSDESLSRPQQLSPQGYILEVAIESAATAVINLKDSLNEWDSKVGDGDCGSTMFRGASAILEDMKKYYPLNDPAETIKELGSSVRKVMGGTSGILYDIFFRAAYAKLKADCNAIVTPLHWANALEAAIAAVSKYGGASAGYRTLLDALIPASSVLKQKLTAGEDPVNAFVVSAEAAVAGAKSTKSMRAQAGRSSYVSAEVLASVPDPGAMAAASWYQAAALAIKDKYRAT
ncbi:3,4-dihydroxy-2-butanone kinase [Dorcoceras hygrometricum]|uniref:3,4-dihydroxy-2-butanone kinase n=1 Tax=Dorcoceras hygrometricum TaxID=472368 RepID=A0A2Z7BLI3_9LAMI|nr:3,4-dihydroxy-2-butanone kinase [Dorcoceras hygrometricum]